MNLSNWNPFKFARRKSEEKHPIQKHPGGGTASTALTPADTMHQMMQQFFRDPLWMPSLSGSLFPENRWFGDFSPSAFQPSVDVVDEGKSLRITAELPGMSDKDIELSVDSGALTIKGEKRTDASTEENGCYRTERAYGYFQRIVPLPANVSTEGIEAGFDKGVLTVRVPKAKEASETGKRIAIKNA